jgi:hypothetical protein
MTCMLHRGSKLVEAEDGEAILHTRIGESPLQSKSRVPSMWCIARTKDPARCPSGDTSYGSAAF